MRYYRYVEPRDPDNNDFSAETITLSEQEILDYYWDYWYHEIRKKYSTEMVDEGYSKQKCIQDWMTVHWAIG